MNLDQLNATIVAHTAFSSVEDIRQSQETHGYVPTIARELPHLCDGLRRCGIRVYHCGVILDPIEGKTVRKPRKPSRPKPQTIAKMIIASLDAGSKAMDLQEQCIKTHGYLTGKVQRQVEILEAKEEKAAREAIRRLHAVGYIASEHGATSEEANGALFGLIGQYVNILSGGQWDAIHPIGDGTWC